ncbi:Glutelin type-B 5 [Rhynchospora pubera]|uniref:Glutelin type-B 5 n=1 Tax=Rhynchospora pubera TaxID=906938 RepID=A0AAV8ETX4_9POAL|nr:Glutelin type-B 5 [Rhynchospora pubera]
MAASSLLSVSLCLLILCQGSLAQMMFGGQSPWQSMRTFSGPRGCRFDRLAALNPSQRMQFEAGKTEYYEWDNEMMQCAGVAACRHMLEPRGLMLPQYNNAPSLMYIVQGRGIMGTVFPGCPETYQSFQQQSETEQAEFPMGGESWRQQMMRDEHQKVHRFKQGDIIALPAGVTYWCYNDGDVPMVSMQVYDASNAANQLVPRERRFFMAGTHKMPQRMFETEQQQTMGMMQPMGQSIFAGFDTQMLAEALGVNVEMARQLQTQNDPRGEMVFVKEGLRMLMPSRCQEMQQQEFEESMPRWQQYGEPMPGMRNMTNGLDEMFCMMKIRSNIDMPSRADYFNQRGSRVAMMNSQKLPIMNVVQMSASRVVLQRNMMITPYWHMNCHSLMYVTGGQGRVQVVNHRGQTVFDGQMRQGQILLIPQNYAVLKRAAENQMFHWVSFMTNPNPMKSQMVGKESVLRAMPLQVLMYSYRLSMEQARMLKFRRQHEMTILGPMYQLQMGSNE